MSQGFTINVEQVNKQDFDRTWNEYLKWNKRQPSEIVNGKLYFIALQAMRNTKMADRDQIKNKLLAPSTKYPGVPLAAILVNRERKSKNKKGLYGADMALAIDKFIKKSQSKIQFLRSGWIPALKILDFWNKHNPDNLTFIKRFAPQKPKGIRQYGAPKGNALPANPNKDVVIGVISNNIGKGKQASPTVQPILQDGLNKGVMQEIRSMKTYIERKYRESFDRMNRTGKI